MDYIGALVKKFESGNRGSLALGSCGNDWGLSCGSYQLTLRWGNCIKFLKKYFPDNAKNLYFNNKKDLVTTKYPGNEYCSSPETVIKVWKECYNKVGKEKFFEFEHEYIQNAYYEPIMKKLNGYFNPNNHSRAMQECMWSWAVHRGSTTAYNEFKAACTAASVNPQSTPAAALIDIAYDKRYSVFSATRYKNGAGASSERETLRSYCNTAPLKYSGTCASTGVADGVKSGKATNTPQTAGNPQNGANKTPYMVKITASVLNVRKGPGTNYPVAVQVKRNEVYTIVGEEMNGSTKWGKLKSGAGYICLAYTSRM